MPGIFLIAYHTTAGNIALPESLIGTRAGLAQRQWLLIVYRLYNQHGGHGRSPG
jgi:hypothetical protein